MGPLEGKGGEANGERRGDRLGWDPLGFSESGRMSRRKRKRKKEKIGGRREKAMNERIGEERKKRVQFRVGSRRIF